MGVAFQKLSGICGTRELLIKSTAVAFSLRSQALRLKNCKYGREQLSLRSLSNTFDVEAVNRQGKECAFLNL